MIDYWPIVCVFPSPPFERDAANAAFIVRACNSHEALLAALRQIETGMGCATKKELQIVARAAIAAATGEDGG